MIRAWDRYWFGPVAGVRPYLILKIVLCLLAFDVWRHRIPLGWEYGANGFNVAQFYWLDAVQPVPSPELYVGLMLTVGILALVCALTDPGRWARALLAVLFSYGWLMSLLNVYQHYYLLSLVLIAFVFFPRSRAQDLYALPAVRPTASAWAYRLLGVTLAIVYLFTVVTKLDAEWRRDICSGGSPPRPCTPGRPGPKPGVSLPTPSGPYKRWVRSSRNSSWLSGTSWLRRWTRAAAGGAGLSPGSPG
jgi:HTTM domain